MADAQHGDTSHLDDGDGGSGAEHSDADSTQPPRKRQRIRLSCLECRRRKLSCSRELPCDRCIKSGTPERCSYESRVGPAGANRSASVTDARRSNLDHNGDLMSRRDLDVAIHGNGAKDHDRIRKLELEVQQLKSALLKQTALEGSTIAASPSTLRGDLKETPREVPPAPFNPGYHQAKDADVRFQWGRNFKTRYFGPCNSWSSLNELTDINPFIKETAQEWLRPLNIGIKDRAKKKTQREEQFLIPNLDLEMLLPSRDETEALLDVYLTQFEQIHRIVHIPSFRKEYKNFWDPGHARPAAFTALVLSMLCVASCLGDEQTSSSFVGVTSTSFQRTLKWVKACEEWHDKQSQKHRKLVHYQVRMLIYIAKRINVIKKKRFWTTACSMVQDGIVVGLHRDPSRVAGKISPFYQEIRRRMWATMQELELQASFDQGLPTLQCQVSMDVQPPRNIDDDEFDESTTELPTSRPFKDYTFSSSQHVSRESLNLRLELSRVLTGTGSQDLDWDQILRYTELLQQEVDALPKWDIDDDRSSEGIAKPMLAYSALQIQLLQFIIPLHQPYLKMRKDNAKYTYSEMIYYNAVRDIVVLHDKLYKKGIRTLYFLREDTLNAAHNLCNVTLHRPRDSMSVVMVSSHDTLRLVEKCISWREDRILRVGNNDPFGYLTMCAAYGLLEVHLGVKVPEAAKAGVAERFINLHYKLLASQSGSSGSQQQGGTAIPQNNGAMLVRPNPASFPTPVDNNLVRQMGNTPYQVNGTVPTMPWMMPETADPTQPTVLQNDMHNMEILGMELNDVWGDWVGSVDWAA